MKDIHVIFFFLANVAFILCILALIISNTRYDESSSSTQKTQECLENGSCMGGIAVFEQLIVENPIVAPNMPINVTFLLNLNIDVQGPPAFVVSEPGSNIVVTSVDPIVQVSVTQAVVVDSLESEYTHFGTNTSCIRPIQPTCYDLSSQTCPNGSLLRSCVPQNMTLDTLEVTRYLIVSNNTFMDASPFVNNSNVTIPNVQVHSELIMDSTMTCSGGAQIDQNCLHLANTQCESPLNANCIPDSLPFYNVNATNSLNLSGSFICLGPPLDASCFNGMVTNGDAAGPLTMQQINSLQGNPVDAFFPPLPSALVWNGTAWIPKLVNALEAQPLSIMSRDANGNSSAYKITSEAAQLQGLSGGSECVGLGRPVVPTHRFYFSAGTLPPPTNVYFSDPIALWYYDSVINTNVMVGFYSGYVTFVYGVFFSPAGILYGTGETTSPNPIWHIDIDTAYTTFLCNTDGGAFAFHADGTLYELTPSGVFYSFDISTCTATFLKTLASVPPAYGVYQAVVIDDIFLIHLSGNLWTFDVGAMSSNVPLIRTMPGGLGHTLSSAGELYSECIGGKRVPASFTVSGSAGVSNTSAFDPVSLQLITSQMKWTNVNNPGIVWNAGFSIPGFETRWYPWGGIANSCFFPKTTAVNGTCLPSGSLDLDNNDLKNVHGLSVTDIYPSTLNSSVISVNNFGLQMGRYSILFADNTTRITINSNNGPFLVNEGSGTMLVNNQVSARRIQSNLGSVSLVAGPGAGATTPSVLTVTNARACKWIVSLTTTATPAINSIIFDVVITGQTSFSPGVVFSPRVLAAAALAGNSQPYVINESLTGFSFMSNSVALSDSTNYQWTFQYCV